MICFIIGVTSHFRKVVETTTVIVVVTVATVIVIVLQQYTEVAVLDPIEIKVLYRAFIGWSSKNDQIPKTKKPQVLHVVSDFLLASFTAQEKQSFPFDIFSVNVTKSAVSRGFGHIYWRNPPWKISFFAQNLLGIKQIFPECVPKSEFASEFLIRWNYFEIH